MGIESNINKIFMIKYKYSQWLGKSEYKYEYV
jgi:hypothetical protein